MPVETEIAARSFVAGPLRTTLLVLLFFAASGVATAQGRSSVTGFVFDQNRRPIGQVAVELHNETNRVIGRVRTDGSGRFFFSGLGHGRYMLRVLPLGTGFAEQSVEFEIFGLGVRGQPVSENVQKDIYLVPSKSSASAPFRNEVVFVQEVPREAEQLYKDAVSELDRNKPDTGIAGLEKAVAVFPTYFAALQRLGTVRLVQERFADAGEMFKRAIAVNEKSFDSWYGLAYAQYADRKFSEAVSSAGRAAELGPDSVEVNLLLGMSQRITKDLVTAERSLKKAAKLSNGSSADVHWQLALLYGKDGTRFDEAARELELYLKLSPDAPNQEDVKRLIKHFREKARPGR